MADELIQLIESYSMSQIDEREKATLSDEK